MVASAEEYINGATWLDIAFRTGGKTLMTLTEDDWLRVASFRQGTLTPNGEAPTTTPINHEDGSAIVSATTRGTYGFTGDLPNFAPEVVKLLLKTRTLDVSSAPANSWLAGRAVESGGGQNEVTANVFVRLPVINSPGVDYLCFYNATITASWGPTGDIEDITVMNVVVSCISSMEADSQGDIYTFVYKAGSSGVVPPTISPDPVVIPQGGTVEGSPIIVTANKPLASLTAAPTAAWLTISESTTTPGGTVWELAATRNDTGSSRQVALIAVAEDQGIYPTTATQAGV
jgi:hypothetical protein